MKKNPTVLAVIVARAGSKRLPGKNMLPIGNSPMIYYSILAAKESKHITKVAVSTDSDEIGAFCLSLDCDFIKRPPEISGDDAGIESAVKHAAEKYHGVDLVVTLQAAVPFRPAGMIDALIDEVIKSGSGGGVTMVKAAPWSWSRSGAGIIPNFDNDNYPRSQDIPPAFQEINAAQVTPIDIALSGERYLSPLSVVVMPDIFAADIDDFSDYCEAREKWKMIKHHYLMGRDYVTFTDQIFKE